MERNYNQINDIFFRHLKPLFDLIYILDLIMIIIHCIFTSKFSLTCLI